jgi:ribonuclease HI
LPKISVYTDGASRNNPGESGIGVVIYDENNFILESYCEYIGTATNNQAEYKAIIKSLDLIKKLVQDRNTEFDEIAFFSDSDLIVNQINFDFETKEPELAVLNNKFHYKIKKIGIKYTLTHIDREKNKCADRLANMAIDKRKEKEIK